MQILENHLTVITGVLFSFIFPWKFSGALDPQCHSDYKNYGNCVKGKVSENFENYEKEYRNWFRIKRNQCFSTKGNGPLCPFPKQEYKVRPLSGEIFRNCEFCDTAAYFMESNMVRANSSTKECINRNLFTHMAEDLHSCMAESYGPDYQAPEYTSFDSGEYQFHESKVESWNSYLLLGSKIEFCKTARRFKKKFPKTKKCLETVNLKEEWHCSTHSGCINELPSQCQDEVQTHNNRLCECLDRSRIQLRNNLGEMQEVVHNTLNGRKGDAKRCAKGLMTKMFPAKQNSRKSKAQMSIFDGIAKECLGYENVKMLDLMRQACKHVIKKRQKGLRDLQQLNSFIINFLDSAVGRYGRFCQCTTF